MANMFFKSQSIARSLRICSISPSFSLALPQTVLSRTTSSSSAATSNASSTEARPRKIPTCADLVAAAPSSIKPYLQLMRLNSPTGSWLLFWPCTWSIALATPAGHLPSLYYLFLFGAGSVLMRGAGCVVNDIIDRDFDRKVERTKLRPLACGILSQRQAVHFLAVLLSASLVILLQFNWFSVAVGSSSLFLVAAYPFAKRFTYWPQFVLGATLNWGVLIAWAEMLPREQFYTVLPLYFSTVLHTVIYDTIYSHQQRHSQSPISTSEQFASDEDGFTFSDACRPNILVYDNPSSAISLPEFMWKYDLVRMLFTVKFLLYLRATTAFCVVTALLFQLQNSITSAQFKERLPIAGLLYTGLTFNWGALLGWSATQGSLSSTPIALYLAALQWTLLYDTIYAHQDKADDILIGVKSTALRFGENTRYWLSGFGSAAIAGLALTGHLAEQTWPYYVALAGTAMHLGWQVGTLKINDGNDCWKKFKSNQWFGAILFAGIVAGTLMKDQETAVALDNDDEFSDKDSK